MPRFTVGWVMIVGAVQRVKSGFNKHSGVGAGKKTPIQMRFTLSFGVLCPMGMRQDSQNDRPHSSADRGMQSQKHTQVMEETQPKQREVKSYSKVHISPSKRP